MRHVIPDLFQHGLEVPVALTTQQAFGTSPSQQ
jgi:hypothetical protein